MGASYFAVRPSGVNADTGDVSTPSAATDAVVTYAAVSGKRHCISGLMYSYSAAPTGGNIKIEDGAGNAVLDIAITAAGEKTIYFDPAKSGTSGRAMIVTLASGAGAVVGKLSVLGHWTE